MDTTYCNITGGWMRLAYLNTTEPGASCPTSLRQINTPAKLCGRHTAPGCSGITFPTDGICYSKVCGQARGYQCYSISAIGDTSNNIYYSITYAVGLSDDYNYGIHNCPCAVHPGRDQFSHYTPLSFQMVLYIHVCMYTTGCMWWLVREIYKSNC